MLHHFTLVFDLLSLAIADGEAVATGRLDEVKIMNESLIGIHRAGTGIIFTYFTK